MAVVTIRISRWKPTQSVCLVETATVNPADTVTWQNDTADDVIVFFPHDDVFGAGSRHFHKTIQPPASGHNTYAHAGGAQKKNAGGPPEHYQYVVFCKETMTFAIGGSEPEIIVP